MLVHLQHCPTQRGGASRCLHMQRMSASSTDHLLVGLQVTCYLLFQDSGVLKTNRALSRVKDHLCYRCAVKLKSLVLNENCSHKNNRLTSVQVCPTGLKHLKNICCYFTAKQRVIFCVSNSNINNL